MNGLKPPELLKELGQNGLVELERLHNWLKCGNPRTDNWQDIGFPTQLSAEARYAPSIITRSEAELFGTSMPRFAIRVYFQSLGFVNARRTGVFADQARRWSSRRNYPIALLLDAIRPLSSKERLPDNRFRVARKSPGWILHTNSCVADSMLVPPQRLTSEGFDVLRAPAKKLYGEGQEHAVPYIKHIPLSGGGLCAQAVSFMATVLQHEHASQIFGVSEITKLIADPKKREFRITGLTISDICQYFSHDKVGLFADFQVTLDAAEFQFVLRSYLLSGQPLIMPVDAGRVAGDTLYQDLVHENICKSNGIQVPPYRISHARPHAILLVGCNHSTFLINDPLHFPFMTATAGQLLEVGIYGENAVYSGGLIPVTPRGVRLPLSKRADLVGSNVFTHYGLWDMLGITQRSQHLFDDIGYFRPGEVRLCSLSAIDANCEKDQSLMEARPAVREMVDTLLGRGWDPDHWVWVQRTASRLWLWDAQLEPPEFLPHSELTQSIALRHLVGVIACEDAQWLVKCITIRTGCFRAPVKQEEIVRSARQTNHLSGSVLTSISTRGFGSAVRSCSRRRWRVFEAYLFMQRDAVRCLGYFRGLRGAGAVVAQLCRFTVHIWLHNLYRRLPLGRWLHLPTLRRRLRNEHTFYERLPSFASTRPLVTALDRMALCGKRVAVHRKIARRLAKKAGEVGGKIIGLASFVSEVTSPFRDQRDRATEAIRFMLGVARALKEPPFKQPVHFVELVAGSLIDGIWPGVEKAPIELAHYARNKTIYVANVLSDEEALSRLIEVLKPLALYAAEAEVFLLLELEPGPLYVLRDLATVDQLCHVLETEKELEDLNKVIRFNLDIAHFSLAGHTPSDVRKFPRVMNRLIHCHCSDFYKGHLGDLFPGAIHDAPFFKEWLDLIGELSENPEATRYVSCEMEACGEEMWLEQAKVRLTGLGVTV